MDKQTLRTLKRISNGKINKRLPSKHIKKHEVEDIAHLLNLEMIRQYPKNYWYLTGDGLRALREERENKHKYLPTYIIAIIGIIITILIAKGLISK
jgi:hypothetical protein